MHKLTRPSRALSDDLLEQSRAEYAAGADPWRAPRPEGWTLPEMYRAARLGSSRIRHGAHRLLGDAIDIAWEGAALAVTDDPHASWSDVAIAAAQAVSTEASQVMHIHRLGQSDAHTGARSAVYWGDWLNNRPLAPDGWLEGMALRQVWEALSPEHRDLLMMAAVLPASDIADRLGVSVSRVSQRLSIARRTAIALWHDWEVPPSRLPRHRVPSDEAAVCPSGHPLSSTRQRGGWAHRWCPTCSKTTSEYT